MSRSTHGGDIFEGLITMLKVKPRSHSALEEVDEEARFEGYLKYGSVLPM